MPKNRNRICFINSNKVWGGGEKWHYETACHLDELGYPVMVVTNRNSDLYYKFKNHERIVLLSLQITNFSFLNPFKLIKLRKSLNLNHVNTVILGLSIDVKLGGVAAKLSQVEHIIYRKGSAIPVKNSLMNRFLFRSVLTDIITNSREIKANIFENNPRIIDDEKVHVVYNGINLKNWPDLDFFKRSRHDGDILILGNAGRLVEQKGHDHLIKVARHLKDQNLAFKLFIAGSGKLEKALKKACRENQLEEEIVFFDFVENMTDFLKSLDIYLSTSLHEGSSHVVIESMASGKPVIAFDVSSMPELVDNGETGFLIPFPDTLLFAEKIIFLNNNSSELERLGNNARAKVESNFNFASNLQQVLNLIRT